MSSAPFSERNRRASSMAIPQKTLQAVLGGDLLGGNLDYSCAGIRGLSVLTWTRSRIS
jgi:hypothetical protein